MLHVIRENFDLTQTKAASLVGIKEVEYILAENKVKGTLSQVTTQLLLTRLEKIHPVYRNIKAIIRSVKRTGKLPELIIESRLDAWTIKQIERGLEKPTQELLTKLQKAVDNLDVNKNKIKKKESKEMTKAQRVKALRKELGMTQEQLGNLLGTTGANIGAAEHNRNVSLTQRALNLLTKIKNDKDKQKPKDAPVSKVSTEETVFDKITGTALTIRELSLALDKHRETLSQLTVEAGIELPEEHTTADLIKEALYQKFISENIAKETV